MADTGMTHFDEEGRPRMVDVSDKGVTSRIATAEGRIVMSREALTRIRSGATPKGNPLHVAELAGIMAGKRTADLIPLCHQLPGASIEVSLEPDERLPGVVCRARAHVSGQTGVEMEALVAVAVALLTLYDMVKGLDRGPRIEQIRLLDKEGGRSGRWTAP